MALRQHPGGIPHFRSHLLPVARRGALMTMPGNGAAAPGGLNVKQVCTVLYNRLPPLQAAQTHALLSPTVGSDCRVEWASSAQSGAQMVAGLSQWDDHRVVMIALKAPVREEILARTVAVSPMPEELRAYLLKIGRASCRERV